MCKKWDTSYNISLLDFGSLLAGLHIHNTYTHTIIRKQTKTVMQIGNRVELALTAWVHASWMIISPCCCPLIRLDYSKTSSVSEKTIVSESCKLRLAVETWTRKWSEWETGANWRRQNELCHTTTTTTTTTRDNDNSCSACTELCVQRLPAKPRILSYPRAPARYEWSTCIAW